MNSLTQSSPELHRTGEPVEDVASVGSLTCTACGYAVAAAAISGGLPRCPACGGSRFRRASIFERPTVDADAVAPALSTPAWVTELRTETVGHPQVAFEYEGRPRAMKLPRGWTRIGRSAAADIRLDDATVSRRHALIVHTDEGMRVLDDRSLNGLFVNGERADWAPLSDGDELEIGRYRLYVIAPA
jgi:hypothetical protein